MTERIHKNLDNDDVATLLRLHADSVQSAGLPPDPTLVIDLMREAADRLEPNDKPAELRTLED